MRVGIGVAIALACACRGDRDRPRAPAPAVPPSDARPPARIEITAEAITFGGARITGVYRDEIVDLDLAPDDASQPEIVPLRTAIVASVRPDDRITIEIDPALHYQALVLVLYTLAHNHYLHYALVSPPGTPPVDIDTREPAPATDAGAPAVHSMRMIVGVDPGEIVVWSTTGDEGTQTNPLLVAPRGASGYDLVALQKTLRGVVDRRWGGAPRSDDSARIIVVAGAEISARDVVSVVRATRADSIGPLFPDTQLTTMW